MDPWLENFNATREARLQEDRSFELLGERLTVKVAVAPEVGFRLNDLRRTVREEMEATARAAEQNLPAPDVTTDAEMLAVAEDTIHACLEPESLEAWRRLRSTDSVQPLTFREIFTLCDYILARASGIPTGGPTDSSAGPQNTDTSSTDASPSPAELRAV